MRIILITATAIIGERNKFSFNEARLFMPVCDDQEDIDDASSRMLFTKISLYMKFYFFINYI